MGFLLELNIEFDILDAAIYECLPGYAPLGWVEFERRGLTPVSVEYDMFLTEYGDLGDLGFLNLRKIGIGKSLLFFQDPKRPNAKQPTQEEWDSYDFSQYSNEERISKKLQVFEKYSREADELHKRRIEHQGRIIQVLFDRLAHDPATRHVFSIDSATKLLADSPLDVARGELRDFRDLVERQLFKDLFDGNGAQERIARLALQTFILRRSYREVPVRGGRSDILVLIGPGRLLYEAKIWKGKNYHNSGLKELSEYIVGENSDGKLLGAFYIVFDPSKTHRATRFVRHNPSIIDPDGFPIEVVVINIALDPPSKQRN